MREDFLLIITQGITDISRCQITGEEIDFMAWCVIRKLLDVSQIDDLIKYLLMILEKKLIIVWEGGRAYLMLITSKFICPESLYRLFSGLVQTSMYYKLLISNNQSNQPLPLLSWASYVALYTPVYLINKHHRRVR